MSAEKLCSSMLLLLLLTYKIPCYYWPTRVCCHTLTKSDCLAPLQNSTPVCGGKILGVRAYSGFYRVLLKLLGQYSAAGSQGYTILLAWLYLGSALTGYYGVVKQCLYSSLPPPTAQPPPVSASCSLFSTISLVRCRPQTMLVIHTTRGDL